MSTHPRVTMLLGLGGLGTIVGAWHLVASIAFMRPNGTYGAVPSPFAVFTRVGTDLVDPGYWVGMASTAGAAVAGYLLAIGLALVLGVVVLLIPVLEAFASQLGVITACLPVAAVGPIVVVLSPTGSRAVSVTFAFLAAVFPMIIGALLGLQAASPTQLDLIHAYGGGGFTAIRKVRVISAIPAVLSALKIGAPSAFLGAMTGEFFAVGVDSGAGRLLISQQYVGDFVGMWAIAILATVVSATGYGVIALLARSLAPWTTHVSQGVVG